MRNKRIAFIGCSKSKKPGILPAKSKYTGVLFKKLLRYCLKNYDQVYILSAKYGLLPLEQKIDDYDVNLSTIPKEERKKWYLLVEKQMNKLKIKEQDLTFFCGETYCSPFEGERPLAGLSYGRRVQWVNKKNIKKSFFD